VHLSTGGYKKGEEKQQIKELLEIIHVVVFEYESKSASSFVFCDANIGILQKKSFLSIFTLFNFIAKHA
jgi:hypothetical protein